MAECTLQAVPCAAQAKDQDLGVRMHAVLASLLAQHDISKVGHACFNVVLLLALT